MTMLLIVRGVKTRTRKTRSKRRQMQGIRVFVKAGVLCYR